MNADYINLRFTLFMLQNYILYKYRARILCYFFHIVNKFTKKHKANRKLIIHSVIKFMFVKSYGCQMPHETTNILLKIVKNIMFRGINNVMGTGPYLILSKDFIEENYRLI